MFLWKSSCGYVIINVVCDRVEKFINLLLLSGISVHNVEKHGPREAACTLRTRDLDEVRSICAEYQAEMHILRRGGFPVFIACMKARPVLVAFMAAAVLMMLILSRRVLAVEIAGGDELLKAETAGVLREEGVKIGIPVSEVDAHTIETKLTLADDRIAAASVKCDGVVLKIELVGSFREKDESDGRPCSILADKDCVILKIAALDGAELVSVGEAVRKDQLLVSGDVTPKDTETPVLVHARAEIIGKVAYRFTVTVDRMALMPMRSGKTEKLTGISLFGKRIERDPGFEKYEAEFTRSAFLDFSLLPIRISDGKAYELALMNTELTDEEMLAEALRIADERLRHSIPPQARMIAKSTEPVWHDDGSLSLIVAVHTIEKIGYLRYL